MDAEACRKVIFTMSPVWDAQCVHSTDYEGAMDSRCHGETKRETHIAKKGTLLVRRKMALSGTPRRPCQLDFLELDSGISASDNEVLSTIDDVVGNLLRKPICQGEIRIVSI